MANGSTEKPDFASLDERVASAEQRAASYEERARRATPNIDGPKPLVAILQPLASLKLTVVLFATSILSIFFGTLAQRYESVWTVINTYFRIQNWDNLGFVWVDLQILFPNSWEVPGSFPFPSGWLIGAGLFVNLLAAHALRFKVQGKGGQRWCGLGLIALGIVVTAAVIASGTNKQPETQLSDDFAAMVWNGVRAGMLLFTGVLGYMLYLIPKQRRGTAYWILFGIVNLLAIFDLLLYVMPEMQLDKPGLRIMWQLVKGSGAGVILLTGCALVFRRRAGIVLLHAGVGLMMVGELWTGLHSHEAQMPIFEGYPGYYTEDVRVAELAVIDHSDPKRNQEVIIGQRMLVEHSDKKAKPISHKKLPFDVRVIDFFHNVDFFSLPPGIDIDDPALDEETTVPLTKFTGVGRTNWVKKRHVVTGAEAGSRSDLPSAHIELIDKKSKESLGLYLTSVALTLNPMEHRQYVQVGDRFYEIVMRFVRDYGDAEFVYKEFRNQHYVGTRQAKNFSAKLQLVDSENGIDNEVNIWMNNPLRYEGWTYYQSGVRDDPRWPSQEKQGTVLQVVSNDSWLIPYVGCSLVGTGMFAHFALSLVNFLKRRKQAPLVIHSDEGIWGFAFPALIVLVAASYTGSKVRMPETPVGRMQFEGFGRLPAAFHGRVKPIDTVARNAMRVISDREFFEVPTGKDDDDVENRPAVVWLLDVISGSPKGDLHKVVRIQNLEVLNILGLERRKGYRYSLQEIRGTTREQNKRYLGFIRQAQQTAEKQRKEEPLSFLEGKIIELERRLRVIQNLRMSFLLTDAPLNTQEEVAAHSQTLDRLRPALVHVVPPKKANDAWEILARAVAEFVLTETPPQKITLDWVTLLTRYKQGDAKGFNKQLRDMRKLLEQRQQEIEKQVAANRKKKDLDAAPDDNVPKGPAFAEQLHLGRVGFEAWYNHFSAFSKAMVFYIAAFALSILAWLGFSTTLNRTALWLIIFTFALHAFGLIARIYISGRPPVTNLYSSAVFIGWGCVLLGIIFEAIYKLGFGNLIAAAAGFATLLIADTLAAEGDTMKVLQAVLDTNFWLATHVVCITFGYATTYAAGLFGIIYIVMGMFSTSLNAEKQKVLTRMTYGTLCFSILFSFIGTVLGGLWADDSWGRFWGWDPKENGALMIVIWNALVLHARWGGMAGPRGIAVLAVFGNVVTSWSWFGVNQLGVGLHSYGFTSGITMVLTAFCASQVVLIGLGCLPKRMWLSHSTAKSPTATT